MNSILVVICTINIMVPVVDGAGKTLFGISSSINAEGIVKSSSETKYLIDFNKYLKANGYALDKQLRIVNKTECVKN